MNLHSPFELNLKKFLMGLIFLFFIFASHQKASTLVPFIDIVGPWWVFSFYIVTPKRWATNYHNFLMMDPMFTITNGELNCNSYKGGLYILIRKLGRML